MGAFLSFANCVNENNSRSISTATAQTDAVLYGIPFATIKGIMTQNKVFERKVYLYSMIYFVRIYPDKAGPLRGMEENHLNEYVVNSDFLSLHAGSAQTFENGGYLIVGQIEPQDKQKEAAIFLDEFSYIAPSTKVYVTVKNSYILKFKEPLNRKMSVMDQNFEDHGIKKYNQNIVQASSQYVNEEEHL